MGVRKSDCHIKTHVFKFSVDYIEIRIQYRTAVIWIVDLLTILQLLPNLPCNFVCFLFFLNDLFQLLWCKLGSWARTPAQLKFIRMLLRGCLIPTTNATFTELSTAACLGNFFFPRPIIGLNLLTFIKSTQIHSFPSVNVFSLQMNYAACGSRWSSEYSS